MQHSPLVLVTGASGFLGSNIVDQLLASNYRVRGTARPSAAERLKEGYSSFGERFQVTVLNNFDEDDLTAAVDGIYALIHVAWVFPPEGSRAKMSEIAVKGVQRLSQAALAAGAKKIVVTSGIGGLVMIPNMFKDRTIGIDENPNWTLEDALKPGTPAPAIYSMSKYLADSAMIEFGKAHPEVQVSIIHPPWTYGPYGHGQVIKSFQVGTNHRINALINGPKGRLLPKQGFNPPQFCHVADAARAHVLALEAPPSPTGPRRVIAVAGAFTWRQAVAHLAKARPELKDRLPVIPDEPDEFAFAKFDVSSAAEIGLTEYIGWEMTVEDTVDDILKREAELKEAT
ncbi:NAD-P-binding protein [Auriscalpium vulgare]|uniref:NAD-P-binding protein n=1 Tax=Auriscalpium vulgare TaxID=40419 RepID=A0ACB8RGU7_9AGAM|nr:NAD-P-binding protein [Auriscalpium vulgare]